MRLFFLLLACAAKPATPPAPSAEVAPPTPPKAEDPARMAVRVHMAEHLAHANLIRDAVVQGRFDQAREGFDWMATHRVEEAVPPEWMGWLDELRASASAGAQATTTRDQAMALGEMANACGCCHETLSKGPLLPVPAAPDDNAGLRFHMARHSWVNDRMWAALIEPDAAGWQRSLRVLGPEAITAAELEDWGQLEGAEEQGHKVHVLAHAALADDNPDTRADLYGQIVAECAACHRYWGR